MTDKFKLFIIGITLFCSFSLVINSASLSYSLVTDKPSLTNTQIISYKSWKNNLIKQNNSGVSRFQTLAEGDKLYRLGQVAAAEILYRKAKPNFLARETTNTK